MRRARLYKGVCMAWALVAAVALVAGLAGCRFLGEPTSTESLLVRYATNPQNDSFVANAMVDVALRVSGVRVSIPVDAQLRAAGGSAYGTVTVDASSLGEVAGLGDGLDGVAGGLALGRSDLELYVEVQDTEVVWYVGDGSTWTRSAVDLDFTLDIPALVELLSDAAFRRVAYESDPQIRYELVLPASSLAQTIMGKGHVSTTLGDVNEDAVLDVLGNSKVHVYFNADCLIRSAKLDLDFARELPTAPPMTAQLDIDIRAVFDQYGTVATEGLSPF